METLLKQCVGIDVAKSTFVASICRYFIDGRYEYVMAETFKNNSSGFNKLVKWMRKNSAKESQVRIVMEATGVYYEALAYHLHSLKFHLSVILPNKVKNYARCLNIKTKTDNVDAKIMARMGTEQSFAAWNPPAEVYRRMRMLTRHFQELKKDRTAMLNRLEAITHSAGNDKFLMRSNKRIVALIDKQIEECEEELRDLVTSDSELAKRIKTIETIKGVSFMTVCIVVAETQGFSMITSRKQLASYAGLDVVDRQSGTSVRGKGRISKKGNSHIRAALFFPAMTAASCNKPLKEDYLRIVEKTGKKLIGLTALQRKLLLLIFTLWKKNEEWNEDI